MSQIPDAPSEKESDAILNQLLLKERQDKDAMIEFLKNELKGSQHQAKRLDDILIEKTREARALNTTMSELSAEGFKLRRHNDQLSTAIMHAREDIASLREINARLVDQNKQLQEALSALQKGDPTNE
jgi:chromosome segregation ATPase